MRSPNRLHLATLCGAALLAVAVSLLPVGMAAPTKATPSASASAAAPAPSSPTLPAASDPLNTCESCHAGLQDPRLNAPAREYRVSVHRDPRVGCVGCHHGDPRDPTVGAHAPSTGFQPRPTHAEIPLVCGGCHSDAAFMRHLNARLPVGQAALYNLSLHGRRTAAGDVQAPTCADCHGVHGVQPAQATESAVSRGHVAELCGGCHADPQKMKKYDMATDQNARWEKGVHGRAFRDGNLGAPTCTGCHGAHASTPPEAASVARACGRCHEDELKYFEQSPHSKGFRERGLSECVGCHDNHDVEPPTALMVGTTPDAVCMKCHSNDPKPREAAEQIAEVLRGARDRAREARARLDSAEAAGLHVAGQAFALDRLSTAELELRSVVHTLDAARVEAPVAAVDGAAAEIAGLVSKAEELRASERRGYYLALCLAGILFGALVLKSIRLDRGQRGP